MVDCLTTPFVGRILSNITFNGLVDITSFRYNSSYFVVAEKTSIRQINPDFSVTTLAGDPILSGDVDGTKTAARFTNIQKIFYLASTSSIYVLDKISSTNYKVRKIAFPSGIVTTLYIYPNNIITSSYDITGIGYYDAAGFGLYYSTALSLKQEPDITIYNADSLILSIYMNSSDIYVLTSYNIVVFNVVSRTITKTYIINASIAPYFSVHNLTSNIYISNYNYTQVYKLDGNGTNNITTYSTGFTNIKGLKVHTLQGFNKIGVIDGDTIKFISCSSCAINTYSKPVSLLGLGSSCVPCPSNSTSPGGLSSTCTCNGGYTQSGSGSSLLCSLCSAGTYSTAGSVSCTKCSAGTYSTAGSQMCTRCSAGTYLTSEGTPAIQVLNFNGTTTTLSPCLTCSNPAIGTRDYVTRVCTLTTNTTIASCPSCLTDNYANFSQGSSLQTGTCGTCTACSVPKSNQYMVQACTETTNTVLRTCDTGSTSSTSGYCCVNATVGACVPTSPCTSTASVPGTSTTTYTQTNGTCAVNDLTSLVTNCTAICNSCVNGTSYSLTGFSPCTPCSPALSCMSAPQNGSVRIECTTTQDSHCVYSCNPGFGYTLMNGVVTCTPCVSGTYSPGGQSSCQSCTTCPAVPNASVYINGCGGAYAGTCDYTCDRGYTPQTDANGFSCVPTLIDNFQPPPGILTPPSPRVGPGTGTGSLFEFCPPEGLDTVVATFTLFCQDGSSPVNGMCGNQPASVRSTCREKPVDTSAALIINVNNVKLSSYQSDIIETANTAPLTEVVSAKPDPVDVSDPNFPTPVSQALEGCTGSCKYVAADFSTDTAIATPFSSLPYIVDTSGIAPTDAGVFISSDAGVPVPVVLSGPLGYDFEGFSLAGTTLSTSMKTLTQCAQTCTDRQSCEGFNFTSLDGACTLLTSTSISETVTNDTRVGFKKRSKPTTTRTQYPVSVNLSNQGKWCLDMTACNAALTQMIQEGVRNFSTNDISACEKCPERAVYDNGVVVTEAGPISTSNPSSYMLYQKSGSDQPHIQLQHGHYYRISHINSTDSIPILLEITPTGAYRFIYFQQNFWIKYFDDYIGDGFTCTNDFTASSAAPTLYQLTYLTSKSTDVPKYHGLNACQDGSLNKCSDNENLIDFIIEPVDFVINGFKIYGYDSLVGLFTFTETFSSDFVSICSYFSSIENVTKEELIFMDGKLVYEGWNDYKDPYITTRHGSTNHASFPFNPLIFKVKDEDLYFTLNATKFGLNDTFKIIGNKQTVDSFASQIYNNASYEWSMYYGQYSDTERHKLVEDWPTNHLYDGHNRTFTKTRSAESYITVPKSILEVLKGGTVSFYYCDVGMLTINTDWDSLEQYICITNIDKNITKNCNCPAGTTNFSKFESYDMVTLEPTYSKVCCPIQTTYNQETDFCEKGSVYSGDFVQNEYTSPCECPGGFINRKFQCAKSALVRTCTEPRPGTADYVTAACTATSDTVIATRSCPNGRYASGFSQGNSAQVGNEGTCTDCISSWSGCESIVAGDYISCGNNGIQYATFGLRTDIEDLVWCIPYLSSTTTLVAGNWTRTCTLPACPTSLSPTGSSSTSLQLQSPDGTKYLYFSYTYGSLVITGGSSPVTVRNPGPAGANWSYTYRFNTDGSFYIYNNTGSIYAIAPIPGSTAPYTLQVSNAGAMIIVDSASKVAWSSNMTLSPITATCSRTVTWSGVCSAYTSTCGPGGGIEYGTSNWSTLQTDIWSSTEECASVPSISLNRTCDLPACSSSLTGNDTTKYTLFGLQSDDGSSILSFYTSAPYFIITKSGFYGNYWTSNQSLPPISYMKFLTDGSIVFYNSSNQVVRQYTIQSRAANTGPFTLKLTNNGNLVVMDSSNRIVMRNLVNVWNSTVTVDSLYYGIDCYIPTTGLTFSSCTAQSYPCTATGGTQSTNVGYQPPIGPNTLSCPTTLAGFLSVTYLANNQVRLTRECNKYPNCCVFSNETCSGPNNTGTCSGNYATVAGAGCPYQYISTPNTCGYNNYIYYTPTGSTTSSPGFNLNDPVQRTGTYSYGSYKGIYC